MRLLERPIAAAKLVGGRLCLDFINTVSGRVDGGAAVEDRLTEYSDLAAWALRAGLETGPAAIKMVNEAAHDPTSSGKVLDRAIALRDACYRLVKGAIASRAPSSADVAILNREWSEALKHRALTVGAPYLQLQWFGAEHALDKTLWAVAESAVQLLGTPAAAKIRECGGPNCGWLFEDLSRNRSRQWCDMQMCGNLAKVRRFRERKRS